MRVLVFDDIHRRFRPDEEVLSGIGTMLARHEGTLRLAYAPARAVLSRMDGSVGDAVTIELRGGDDRRVHAKLVHEERPGVLIDLPPAPPTTSPSRAVSSTMAWATSRSARSRVPPT